jgi:hypothetical protein
MNERHDIQEFRNHIMAIKQEIVALDQVALSVDFMTNQHGLLTGHVIEEQQQLKKLQFETIKKLKELQHDTQVECKKLEDQCNQMDAQMQAVEQALLEKPPDRASMNEIATKKATLKLEMRETKAKAESLEAKLKTMLVRMGMQPTYTLREVEGAQPFYFISNDAFLENFQSFEDKVFKGETDITTKAMRIAQLESEIMMFNEEYESTMQQRACAREEQKEVIDLKCKQEQAAQGAVAAEEARLARTESLLIDIERALANANDKLARAQPLHDNKAPLPIRQVFVPPVPDLAHIRTRKLLEARLFKMLGSKTVVLGTDLLCNAGTVDLLCHDRRERLILICFANPLTGYTIDTALVNHSAEIQAAFYMLRRLPPSAIDALKNCFLETGVDAFRDILNARVHRFVIIGEHIDEDCDTSSFASGVELIKADDIAQLWHGEATKRALFGGVPSPDELVVLISSDTACTDAAVGLADRVRSLRSERAWEFLRAKQKEGKLETKAITSATQVTYQQFLDWIQRAVPPRKFALPPDCTIDEVVKQFIIKDMKWAVDIFEPADEAKFLKGRIGPQAIYRYVAQMGEHIKLFSACGVTFTELSPSPPPPEADCGLETIVQAWRAAAAVQDDDASPPATESDAAEPQAQVGPAKHEVAGGTWIVEAIARLVLRYIGCLPPMKEEEQQADLEALRLALRNSQADDDKDKMRREVKQERQCSKKFEALSHAEEFLLFGHQMVESQGNLKECEGLLDHFLEYYAGAIAAHNAEIEKDQLASFCDDMHTSHVRRRHRDKVLVRPPSLSSSDEDEAMAHHRKCFEEVGLQPSCMCDVLTLNRGCSRRHCEAAFASAALPRLYAPAIV